jgi:polyhydroxyalkanoate synthesis regulator phasin
MINFLKNTVLAGIGATVVTAEKVESVLQDLVDKGKITAEESRAATRKIIEEGRKEFESSQHKLQAGFDELLENAPVVLRKDFDNLKKRVTQLEAQIAEVEAKKK